MCWRGQTQSGPDNAWDCDLNRPPRGVTMTAHHPQGMHQMTGQGAQEGTAIDSSPYRWGAFCGRLRLCQLTAIIARYKDLGISGAVRTSGIVFPSLTPTIMTEKSKIPPNGGDQSKSKTDVEELDSKLAETKLDYDASASPTRQSPPPAFSEFDPLSTDPPPNIFDDPVDVDLLKHDSDGDSFYSDFEHLGEDIVPSADGTPGDEWEQVLVGDRPASPQVALSQEGPSVHSPPPSPSRPLPSTSPQRQQAGSAKSVKLAGPLGRPAPISGNTKDLLCIVCVSDHFGLHGIANAPFFVRSASSARSTTKMGKATPPAA